MVKRKKLLDEHEHFFLGSYLCYACFVSNVLKKVVGLTNLNIWGTAEAMLIKFCIVNTPRC